MTESGRLPPLLPSSQLWRPAVEACNLATCHAHPRCAVNVTGIGWEEGWQALQVADFMVR